MREEKTGEDRRRERRENVDGGEKETKKEKKKIQTIAKRKKVKQMHEKSKEVEKKFNLSNDEIESIFDLMGDLVTFPTFLYLVVFATVINFPLYNLALSKIPVAWVSLYTVFVPPIGALFSYYFLNEPISQQDIIAIFIILSGVFGPIPTA